MTPLRDVSGLTKRFGGVLANDGVSFAVNAGEMVGIIGPNGAGKSTLFELITGFVRPDAGRVRLDGRPFAGLSTWQINRAGIARTFQKMRLFLGMTALENVIVGAVERARGSTPRAPRRAPASTSSSWPSARTCRRGPSRPASASASSWRARSPRVPGSCWPTR